MALLTIREGARRWGECGRVLPYTLGHSYLVNMPREYRSIRIVSAYGGLGCRDRVEN